MLLSWLCVLMLCFLMYKCGITCRGGGSYYFGDCSPLFCEYDFVIYGCVFHGFCVYVVKFQEVSYEVMG
jgi:hypothetical protein